MDAFATFGMDISFLELFMLRVSVEERIKSLKQSQKDSGELYEPDSAHKPFAEMLAIYEPLFQKIDTEIEKRSVKSALKDCFACGGPITECDCGGEGTV